jgi:hypothetical protein
MKISHRVHGDHRDKFSCFDFKILLKLKTLCTLWALCEIFYMHLIPFVIKYSMIIHLQLF